MENQPTPKIQNTPPEAQKEVETATYTSNAPNAQNKPVSAPILPSKIWGAYPETSKMSLIVQMKDICQKEGLTSQLTQDLIRTCWAESGLNPNCENETTFDYGLCQFNIKYYLKPNNITPEEAIANPLKCVAIMARSFKAGRANDWIAHRNGNYLKCPSKYLI